MSRDGVRSELAFLQSRLDDLRSKIDSAPKKELVTAIGDVADLASAMAFDIDKSGLDVYE